jgi:hypothetical protein
MSVPERSCPLKNRVSRLGRYSGAPGLRTLSFGTAKKESPQAVIGTGGLVQH